MYIADFLACLVVSVEPVVIELRDSPGDPKVFLKLDHISRYLQGIVGAARCAISIHTDQDNA